MTSQEIRQSFLDFFASKGHTIVPSAPVIPHGDKTLLFTNAGMNQFKDVFLGEGSRPYSRAADTQKCLRVSGKHNDLEEVGHDTYHHTLFEMLGNWSFGDYYKKEAIAWAWELLTEVWKLDKSRLYATVYEKDDEAFELWKTVTDIDPSHIQRHGAKDNFWEMGETGPCGPCSEIHFDRTPDSSGGPLVNKGVPEVIEVWNLVFIQNNRLPDGTLQELPAKHVDTGMGFERICAVLQGKNSNYDTDVFTPYISELESMSGHRYGDRPEYDIAMRVISDHIRALSCAIADGALPGNEGRGYVLRRILRRAARYGRKLGLTKPFLHELSHITAQVMGAVFPELRTRGEMVAQVLHAEEESFNATLDRGLELFDEIVARTKKTIAGDDAFKLYDTFGFPIDLTNILAAERGLSVDMHRFEVLLNEQKTRSKKVHESKKHHEIAAEELEGVATEFIGYDVFQASSKVIYANGDMVILDQSPFYAESGGQISDIGTLTMNGITYHVIDTRKTAGGKAIAHYVDNDDTAELLGISAASRIDVERRFDIMRNHTATHLVHSALRKILGEHVHQAGSLVSENNLRFDFSHFQRVDDEQLRDIEALVNDKIREAIGLVHHRSIPFDDAKKMGALMFFGDKYGDRVNVVDFGPFSREFCGGTHVKNTSEIGLFKLVSESSIASGTRRIEAVTGKGVEKWINDKLSVIDELSREREKLEDDKRKLEKELAKLRLSARASEAQQIADSVEPFKDTAISYSAKLIKASSSDEFKSFAEMVQSSLHPGSVILLGAAVDDKASLIAMVSDDLVKEKKLSAGKIVSAAAEIVGGKGGGKPNFAQAGGKNPENLQRAVNNLPEILITMVAS